MNRTILIGDVHGCAVELTELLGLVAPKPSDRVVFLGDLVDRGPDSHRCVTIAQQHECILGNHEDSLVRRRARGQGPKSEHHADAYKFVTDAQLEWLASRPLWLEVDGEYGPALCVHGGVIPDVPMREQKRDLLLHGQMIRKAVIDEALGLHGYYKPTDETWWVGKEPQDVDVVFWAHAYEGPHIYFGHTVFENSAIFPYAVGLDTGCVYGGKLTALELPSGQVYEVAAKAVHYPKERAWRDIANTRTPAFVRKDPRGP